MKKLLKEPLLHFLALGAALFALNAWRESQRLPEDAAPRIEVTEAVIERLRAGYEKQFSRSPDVDELRGLVTAHIREEVLFREALNLGLDSDDTIVRRRLAQKMEFLTSDIVGVVGPDEPAVRGFFEKNSARYQKPARVSFRHVYFSSEKRGKDAESAAVAALAALEKGANDETFGDPFLHGYEFTECESDDVIALFGGLFAMRVEQQSVGAWRGPVASSYGVHLLKVTERIAPRPLKLDDVREVVLRDLNEERRRIANQEIFEKLRERYKVDVNEAALTKAAVPSRKLTQR